MTIRTRFAPSPTGLLHVGGVRTALFSWLYAKRHNGDFVLRIEDTDRERSTQESVDAILDGMNWLGLLSDEGPYYQTKRYDRYEEVIEQLLAEGKAYHCYCSKERLEELREKQLANKEKPRYDGCCRDKNLPHRDQDSVVRFKNPLDGDVYFQDQVYGDITISNQELDDLIIRRSDGNPTYNFTVVIDDWDMQISHVIRGDDHINNTPRQINIFKALGAPVPIFAHLPMILGDDGKRLSKRHGAVGVMEFQRMGILPAALLNYLVRLGWSHGDQEIFSLQEMQQLFNLDSVSRGVSSFNYEKLNWLNQHYQKNLSFELVGPELHWHFENQKVNPENGPDLQTLLELQAERCDNLAEVVEKSLYFYQDEVSYDEQAVKKNLRPVVMEPLKMIRQKLGELSTWQHEAMHQVVIEAAEHFELKMGKVAQPLRVAVTGNTMSPSIDTTLFLIGKERVLKRLDKALAMIAERMEKSA